MRGRWHQVCSDDSGLGAVGRTTPKGVVVFSAAKNPVRGRKAPQRQRPPLSLTTPYRSFDGSGAVVKAPTSMPILMNLTMADDSLWSPPQSSQHPPASYTSNRIPSTTNNLRGANNLRRAIPTGRKYKPETIKAIEERRSGCDTDAMVLNPVWRRALACHANNAAFQNILRHSIRHAREKSRACGGGGNNCNNDEDDSKIEWVENPRDCDVLLGRGRPLCRHPGNVVFRKLIHTREKEYVSSTSKTHKREIALSIVHTIRSQYKGDFLIRDAAKQKWKKVTSVKRLIDKATQALRERQPLMRENIIDDAIAGKTEI